MLVGPILDANVVAYWRLNETSGSVVADSVGTYPLTASGSPAIVDGQFNKGRRFIDNTQVIAGSGNVAAENVFKAAFTLDWWMRVEGDPVGGGVVFHFVQGFPREWCQLVVASGQLHHQFRSGATSYQGPGYTLPTLNVFHCYGLRQRSVGGSNYATELFMNGYLAHTYLASAPAPNTFTGAGWGIGRYFNTPANSMPMTAHSFRLSNVARTDAEMLETYRLGSNIIPPPIFPIEDSKGLAVTGTDCYAFPDLRESLALHDGPRMMADVLARRLTTRKGSLSFHPSYGIDLRDYLNDEMNDGLLFAMKSEIEGECENDERVLEADATVTYYQDTKSVRVSIAGVTAEGPFSMVLAVSAVSVDLLKEIA